MNTLRRFTFLNGNIGKTGAVAPQRGLHRARNLSDVAAGAAKEFSLSIQGFKIFIPDFKIINLIKTKGSTLKNRIMNLFDLFLSKLHFFTEIYKNKKLFCTFKAERVELSCIRRTTCWC